MVTLMAPISPAWCAGLTAGWDAIGKRLEIEYKDSGKRGNPYAPDSFEYELWEAGYDQAYDDAYEIWKTGDL